MIEEEQSSEFPSTGTEPLAGKAELLSPPLPPTGVRPTSPGRRTASSTPKSFPGVDGQNPLPGMGGTATLARPYPPEPPFQPLKRPNVPTARWSELLLVIASAFFFNIALRGGIASVASAIGVVLLAMVLICSGRKLRPEARVLLALAVSLAPWLVIRADPALTTVTVGMILVLMSLAASYSATGQLFNSKVRQFAGHLGTMSVEWIFGLSMIKKLLQAASANRRGAALLRGLLVAVPVVIVFGLLLASADGVFASFLLLGSIDVAFGHLVLTLIVAIGLMGVVSRGASDSEPIESFADLRRLGRVEVKMVLGSVVVLFAAFVVTQVVVALGGADHVLETEGLTQADHARRGFFQLLAVAGLSMALVATLRAVRVIDTSNDPSPDRFRLLALLTLGLTIVIAGVSVQRLLLYVGSFGLTPDRLWALVGAGAIGVAIVIYALSIGGFKAEQSWYPAVVLVLGFAVVVGLNVMNPHATIATYNISEFGGSEQLDANSLSRLSNDATSTIVSRLSDVQDSQGQLVSSLCSQRDRDTSYGFLEYNRAEVSADNALDELCGSTRLSSGSGN